MDIAILAGGYGTRLKGLWEGPKCLVPYRGRPIIEHIVDKALKLKPRKIFLLLGHQASKVVAWRETYCPHRNVIPIIETVPEGTAAAIRNAFPFITPRLLILNGDTIPEYDLSKLTEAFDEPTGRTLAAWDAYRNCHAGASVFGAHGIDQIVYSKEAGMGVFVNSPSVQRFHVAGFLDVGTPEGFTQAQTAINWPKDYNANETT